MELFDCFYAIWKQAEKKRAALRSGRSDHMQTALFAALILFIAMFFMACFLVFDALAKMTITGASIAGIFVVAVALSIRIRGKTFDHSLSNLKESLYWSEQLKHRFERAAYEIEMPLSFVLERVRTEALAQIDKCDRRVSRAQQSSLGVVTSVGLALVITIVANAISSSAYVDVAFVVAVSALFSILAVALCRVASEVVAFIVDYAVFYPRKKMERFANDIDLVLLSLNKREIDPTV